MRVISLVPSLTETLLDCGVEVVGRTRFCVHPADAVADIPSVGGTKQVNWEACAVLKPDLVVMDKEENTLSMAESCPFPWHATHITSIESVGNEFVQLADEIQNDRLQMLANAWQELNDYPSAAFEGWDRLPGLLQLIGNPDGFKRIEYMIWRDPWMCISSQTFIGSMLGKIGLGQYLDAREKPYPELSDTDVPREDTAYLFSSEPFPFARYVEELESLGFNGALVDGEFYSWFGSRSYRQLKAYLQKQESPP